MKRDITNRDDIDLLMKVFYEKLLADKSISYIFTDVAKIDIHEHLPVIGNFWESILLNKNVYHNNAMRVHTDLNSKSPLLKEHFDTWLKHFMQSVDELFEGNIALLARQRARSVATMMQITIAQKAKNEKTP
jgi:hemoglobin